MAIVHNGPEDGGSLGGAPAAAEEALSPFGSPSVMTKEERRKKRRNRKSLPTIPNHQPTTTNKMSKDDLRNSRLLTKNEDELIGFVAKINKIYQEKLKKPAPFMTFVFCGMQSAEKSTIMERFINAVLNIVKQNTGTRCPLDTTCIHDDSLTHPVCELRGEELDDNRDGDSLNVQDVFERITEVNQRLDDEDRFSSEPLYLTYRAPRRPKHEICGHPRDHFEQEFEWQG